MSFSFPGRPGEEDPLKARLLDLVGPWPTYDDRLPTVLARQAGHPVNGNRVRG